MKFRRVLLGSAASCLVLGSVALAADAPAPVGKTVTLETHMKNVFTQVCAVLMTDECKKTMTDEDKKDMPANVAGCITALSGGMDKDSAKLEVPEDWSSKCVASLKNVKPAECKNTMTAMSSGECDVNKMK